MCQGLCWGHCREHSPRGGGASPEAVTEGGGQSGRGWWAGGLTAGPVMGGGRRGACRVQRAGRTPRWYVSGGLWSRRQRADTGRRGRPWVLWEGWHAGPAPRPLSVPHQPAGHEHSPRAAVRQGVQAGRAGGLSRAPAGPPLPDALPAGAEPARGAPAWQGGPGDSPARPPEVRPGPGEAVRGLPRAEGQSSTAGQPRATGEYSRAVPGLALRIQGWQSRAPLKPAGEAPSRLLSAPGL